MDDQTQLMIDALERAGIQDGDPLEVIATKIIDHLKPHIVIRRTDDETTIDITSSVDAGVFCGFTTGNPKIADYAYPNGKQSGLVRFGQCDRLVGEALGDMLVHIDEIAFTRPVNVGDTVRLTIKPLSSDYHRLGIMTTSQITGQSVKTGKSIMNPSQVKTLKLDKAPAHT